jgi:hypothetical protein
MERLTFLRSQWDRVLAWVAVGLGALLLLLGWIGVSGTGYVFEQLPYVVSGGIGGLFLLGLGAMCWLSADLRDEWRKLDRLEQTILAKSDMPEDVASQQRLDAKSPVATDALVTSGRTGSRVRRTAGS